MPKRKRDGSETPSIDHEDQEDDAHLGARQQRVEHKIVHGHKLLTRAFKLAKGFERQKLSRRRKTAADKGDSKEVTRIDAETEAVKVLDFSSAARNYLYKSLLKSKAVAESPDLPKKVSAPARPLGDNAAVNVVARLCNSNPVKEALPAILRDITQALGVEPIGEGAKFKTKAKPKERGKEAAKQQHNIARESAAINSKSTNGKKQRDLSVSNDEDMSEADVGEPDDSNDDTDDDDFAGFDSRLAGSSNSEDDSDVEMDDGHETLAKGRSSRAELLRAAALHTQSLSPSTSPEPTSKAASRAKPTKSAFVPSLTMGGYWSGSESEPEADIDVAPKKNRRGQRARQALAEKKFGTKAKHLANQQNSGKRERDKGWDPKKGATDAGRRFGRGGSRIGSENRRTQGRKDTAQADSAPPAKKHRDDEGSLHPSWEAAKKAKETKATAPFQGKKITFD